MLGCLEGLALAQQQEQGSIFRRFSRGREGSFSRMVMLEFPVKLRPQTFADAEIVENVGIGYVISVFPERQVFTSIGLNWGRMEWRPTNPEYDFIDVKQFDITQSLNIWFWRTIVFNMGVGLGLMDALVVFSNGRFEHEVLPYIPLQLGVSVPLSKSFWLGLRVTHSPWFGDAALSGNTRLLAGFGFSF